ncbi:MAG: bifunctional homocysteine S-methyltransferase/methylenetetrahydrofolate reductase [Christensenellales bacterium]|jgi:methionine synthase I (cobalamin-dependent)/5,10-methylenetetrahydrofolate reductase
MEPLFFDGAFGTYYRTLTGLDDLCEYANTANPALVRRIHREYLASGATAIKTNTFCLNPVLFPDAETRRALLRAGYELATSEAAAFGARVFADIGPISPESRDAAGDYLSVAEDFLRLGARDFLFETQDDFPPMLPAIRRIYEETPDATVIVSFAISQDGHSRAGRQYAELLKEAREAGVSAAGLNCICGPTHMLQLIRALPHSDTPLIAMPNAGYPSVVAGRLTYRDNPEYFAERLAEIGRAGAAILGGCCGTTPAHIACAARILPKSGVERGTQAPRIEEMPAPARLSRTHRALKTGKLLLAAEISPPDDADCSFCLRAAEELRQAGADVITLPDSPLARSRADSFLMAAKVLREAGIDVMPHLTCRDRNRIAIRGALLGASMEGVGNVLVVTGDPIVTDERQEGEQRSDKNVFSISSVKLIGFIRNLNESTFAESPFLVAGALDVGVENFDYELRRAMRKKEAGVDLLITQPIFGEKTIENLKRARETLQIPILAGILPVASYKNAVFLNSEVRGIAVPEDFVESLKGLDRAAVEEKSVAFAKEQMRAARPFCDGFYLMMPMKKVRLTRALIAFAREELL